MSVSAEAPADAGAPFLLGVGAVWLSATPRAARAAGALVDVLGAAQAAGWRCGLFTIRGGDEAGRKLARSIARRGIEDLGIVFLDRRTPVTEGDVPAGEAFEFYRLAIGKQLRRRGFRDLAARAAAIVVDTSLPSSAVARILDITGRPVVAVESEVGNAGDLAPHLDRLAVTVLRDTTLRGMLGLPPSATIGGMSGALRQAGAAGVVIAAAEPVSCRLAGGAATLHAARGGRRRPLLAEAVAAELPALR